MCVLTWNEDTSDVDDSDAGGKNIAAIAITRSMQTHSRIPILCRSVGPGGLRPQTSNVRHFCGVMALAMVAVAVQSVSPHRRYSAIGMRPWLDVSMRPFVMVRTPTEFAFIERTYGRWKISDEAH